MGRILKALGVPQPSEDYANSNAVKRLFKRIRINHLNMVLRWIDSIEIEVKKSEERREAGNELTDQSSGLQQL